MVDGWLRMCILFFGPVWRQLVSLLNALFFGVVFVAAVMATILLKAPVESGADVFTFPSVVSGNGFLLFLFIFAFNLSVAAFVVVTLPGFLFPPLSIAALTYRAVLWGLLLHDLSATAFLMLLPVIFLEGESYVLAAAAGWLTGFSWIKPRTGQSRRVAFEKALKECSKIYLLVAVFLFVSAAVETETILLMLA